MDSTVQELLQESEARFRLMADHAPVMLWMSGTDAKCDFFNEGWLRFSGRPLDRELGDGWAELVHPQDFQRCVDVYMESFNARRAFTMEYRLRRHDGEYRWILDQGVPRYTPEGRFAGYIGSCVDITERRRAEQSLRSSLQEKEILLKEIHHRVKNNLQIIQSLINLQSARVRDEETIGGLKDCRERLRAMALIHEKLYSSGDLRHVNFGEYVRELAKGLLSTYGAAAVRLKIEAEDVFLMIDQAIPCGLMVYELVSNALKYAFPQERSGEIGIALRRREDRLCLEVGDDGAGLPAGMDFRRTETLGLQLVCNLADQLGGEIALDGRAGTRFTVIFPAPAGTEEAVP